MGDAAGEAGGEPMSDAIGQSVNLYVGVGFMPCGVTLFRNSDKSKATISGVQMNSSRLTAKIRPRYHGQTNLATMMRRSSSDDCWETQSDRCSYMGICWVTYSKHTWQ